MSHSKVSSQISAAYNTQRLGHAKLDELLGPETMGVVVDQYELKRLAWLAEQIRDGRIKVEDGVLCRLESFIAEGPRGSRRAIVNSLLAGVGYGATSGGICGAFLGLLHPGSAPEVLANIGLFALLAVPSALVGIIHGCLRD